MFPLGESRPHLVEVHIVAATNANLDQLVTEGRFREDLSGNYSEYGNLTWSTWLRGIQPVDGNGVARFTTIYPGWYAGRATHIHIEVFVNNRSVTTTQLAFPEAINKRAGRRSSASDVNRHRTVTTVRTVAMNDAVDHHDDDARNHH